MAQIIAALPNGVDSAAVSVVITENTRRRKIEIQRRRDVDPHPSLPDGRGAIDQQALLRLLRENLMDVLTDNSGSVRADQALRHFEPWLCGSIVELMRPQSQDRLLEITERWRALGTQFPLHNTDRTDRKASAE